MGPVGEKIRLERLAKKYSQEYMAWSLEISQAAYSKIERDETEITLRRVFEIAEILEISAFNLMPKPKYSSSILQKHISEVIRKLRNLWKNKSVKKASPEIS